MARCAASDPLVVHRRRARAHWKLRSATRPIHQINVEQIEATGDVSVDPVPGVRMVGLDNRIILLDTVAMIRFPVAQQFWFFGYPTMLAAGGTRVI
jgi:hypothetical protein